MILKAPSLPKVFPKSPKARKELSGNSLRILGVGVNSTSTSSVLEWVRKKLAKREKFWIATPNPEMVVLAQEDGEFKKILNEASLAIPDGQGLLWAAKILGLKLKERIAGTDFLAKLCREAAKEGWRVFFLGGKEKVAQEALVKLQKLYPGLGGLAFGGPKKLKIENFKLKIDDKTRNQEAIERINRFKPDLLFVGFGMGKQERWIRENLKLLKVGGAMVVGGAFDFYSGRLRRAPVWWQKRGLEWLWRLILEPWRWRRQTNLIKFVWLVLKECF